MLASTLILKIVFSIDFTAQNFLFFLKITCDKRAAQRLDFDNHVSLLYLIYFFHFIFTHFTSPLPVDWPQTSAAASTVLFAISDKIPHRQPKVIWNRLCQVLGVMIDSKLQRKKQNIGVYCKKSNNGFAFLKRNVSHLIQPKTEKNVIKPLWNLI